MTENGVLIEFKNEYHRASKVFPAFHSPHEGFGVIKEEYDELWDEIKKTGYMITDEEKEKMKHEAIQLGAMALRFILDICNS